MIRVDLSFLPDRGTCSGHWADVSVTALSG
jgi:hypothetical protein